MSVTERRLYAAAAAIALIALALFAVVWLEPWQRAPGGAPAMEPETAAQRSAEQGRAPSDSTTAERPARSPAEQPEFPARFDRLGYAAGDPDAPVVVREFGDYQCPACARFHDVVARLLAEHVAEGRVRFVYFDFPLTSQHEHAMVAAEAARCAGRQGDYWSMHRELFERQSDWSETSDPVPRFRSYAEALGYDAAALERCVREERTREAVARSRQLAAQLGVRSTPSLVVGNQGVAGGVSYAQLEALIEDARRRQDAGGSEAQDAGGGEP